MKAIFWNVNVFISWEEKNQMCEMIHYDTEAFSGPYQSFFITHTYATFPQKHKFITEMSWMNRLMSI